MLVRPFRGPAGQPTFKQKGAFLEEVEELVMTFQVSFSWAGAHGLLAGVMGAVKYLSQTGKNCVLPVCPPIATQGSKAAD